MAVFQMSVTGKLEYEETLMYAAMFCAANRKEATRKIIDLFNDATGETFSPRKNNVYGIILKKVDVVGLGIVEES